MQTFDVLTDVPDDRIDAEVLPLSPARRDGSRRTRPGVGRRVLTVLRWPVGGIRTHLLYNYSAAAAAGWRFTFVGPADASLDGLRDCLGSMSGSECVGVPVRRRACRMWPTVRRLLRSGDFDVVHTHGLTAAVHTALANVGVGVAHVATLHEPLRDAQFRGLMGGVKRLAIGWFLRRPDAIVVVCEAARANVLEHFPALARGPKRLITIPNGIRLPPPADARTSGELRERLGVGPETTLVGYLGRFMPEKGFPVLLEAVAQLAAAGDAPPFHLAAFGAGDYRKEYQRDIVRRGLDRWVTLLDFVPDVYPVLRQLDLVVMPSLWEASSLLAMEVMAAGVPMLGSDCPGLREACRGTPSRTVATGNADALRHALRLALTDPWTEAARAFVPAARARFDNARSARRLTDLFDQLASLKGTGDRGQATGNARNQAA